MANKLYNDASVKAIADAIRAKNGKTDTYTVAEMAGAINDIPTGGRIDRVEWHQCPFAVRNYLTNVTYDPNDYTTSQIENYAPEPAVQSNTKPIGTTVDGVTYYNDVPNIETPFASTNAAGTLKPLDQLRWINTAATPNVRDLGGWNCDGGTIKYGKILRGGEVGNADVNLLLNEIGIKAELDLQGSEGGTVNALNGKVDYCNPNSDGDSYWCYYSISNKTPMKEAFEFIIECAVHNKPIYIHCSAGADRTGTIACLIEGILGVSQSDIDKDYELTSFEGVDYLRKRCGREYSEGQWEYAYKTLIEKIIELTGATFMDKCINYLVSCGITADQIRAFREAMIDGTPSAISPSVSIFSVTKTETNTAINGEASATQYQGYEAEIATLDDYVINNITVTMGGVDITSQVLSAEKTNRYLSITKTLSNCSMDNSKSRVIEGQGYGATITVDDGYTFDGGTVTITMGGVDVSTYYSNGKIAIPNVTGDIVITATAIPSAPAYTNQIPISTDESGNVYNGLGYKDGARISSSGAESTLDGAFLTGFIPVKAGDTVYLKSGLLDPSWGSASSANSRLYASDKTTTTNAFNPAVIESASALENVVKDSNGYVIQFSIKSAATSTAYIRLTLKGTGANAVVTVNEEIS